MSESYEILTEHLGYAPIVLIDETINAVNEYLLYTTSAISSKLVEKYGEDVKGEVEDGTDLLENKLEVLISKYFDKFELYVLRNILKFPNELVDNGWIRLAHHRNIDFTVNENDSELDQRLQSLQYEIYVKKKINELYQARLVECERCIDALQSYKSIAEGFLNSYDHVSLESITHQLGELSTIILDSLPAVKRTVDIYSNER